MRSAVIGRDPELSELSRFLDRIHAGTAAILVHGEAGAGKTTLWRATVQEAVARGYRVLATSPAAAEAMLSFAGLGDLLHDCLDEALPHLPPAQARALETALLRGEASGQPPNERSLGVAFLSTLRVLADARPVLVAIDDVQWLDAASATVVRFALRRLDGEPVGALLARRTEVERTDRDDLERALGDERLTRVAAAPLSLGALHHVLRERLGAVLPRPLLRRVHETTGGNPFFALEVMRALERRGEPADPRDPLPIPGDLHELVRERVRGLPPATSHALLVVSALAHATLDVLGDARQDLDPAVAAGVVELERGVVRFTHPLLRHAVYALASPDDRAAVHRGLADVVRDPEERGRHLALATERPDAAVAAALELAADAAASRGATGEAAALAERACVLTPPEDDDELARRTLAAAMRSFRAGDTGHARAMLEALVARDDRPADGKALSLFARILRWEGDQLRSLDVARTGLALDGLDDATLGALEHNAGSTLFYLREELDEARAHLERAVALAARAGWEDERLDALLQKVVVDAVVGGAPEADATLEAATELSRRADAILTISSPAFMSGYRKVWSDDPAGAETALRAVLADAAAVGDDSSPPLVLLSLAHAKYLRGEWAASSAIAEEAYEAALQTGQRPQQALGLATRALLHASRGEEEDARADAGAALALTGPRAMAVARIHAVWALGLLELSLERPGEAVAILRPERERLWQAGVREPGSMRFVGDEAEAHAALGDHDEAERVSVWLEEQGEALGRASALGAAHRCRAVLALEAGGSDEALRELAAACAAWERAGNPFELARTLLVRGAAERRAKRRRAARETLAAALAELERLGAARWAEKARAELARIGGRAPSRGELTPTEREVAARAADGLTNREVANALVVSERTVEYHLSNVYRKLGVRSRTELARRLERAPSR